MAPPPEATQEVANEMKIRHKCATSNMTSDMKFTDKLVCEGDVGVRVGVAGCMSASA